MLTRGLYLHYTIPCTGCSCTPAIHKKQPIRSQHRKLTSLIVLGLGTGHLFMEGVVLRLCRLMNQLWWSGWCRPTWSGRSGKCEFKRRHSKLWRAGLERSKEKTWKHTWNEWYFKILSVNSLLLDSSFNALLLILFELFASVLCLICYGWL